MNPPAFPQTHASVTTGKPNTEGMSLRDYFAAKAMAAIFEDGQTWTRPNSYGDCATRAYQMADAMLVERGKAGA